jgi:hypothetical protein
LLKYKQFVDIDANIHDSFQNRAKNSFLVLHIIHVENAKLF